MTVARLFRTLLLASAFRPLRAALAMLAVIALASMAGLPDALRAAPFAAIAVQLNESFSGPLDPAVWTVNDPENELAVNPGGFLEMKPRPPGCRLDEVGVTPECMPPPNSWVRPRLTGPSYARQPGRALIANVLIRGYQYQGPLPRWAMDPSAVTANQDGHGFYIGTNRLQIVRPGKPPLTVQGLQPSPTWRWGVLNSEYIMTVVQRPQGAYYFLSGLPGGTHAVWPETSLVWVDPAGDDATLWPSLTNYSSRDVQVRDVRVVDLDGDFADPSGVALANVADTFSQDRALPGTAPEVGSGPWAVGSINGVQNDWDVVGGRLTLTPNSPQNYGPASATVPATADGLFEVTVRTPPSGPYSAGVVFRAADADNYLVFEIRNDSGGQARLAKVVNGAIPETVLNESTGLPIAYTFQTTPDTEYRLVARAQGNQIQLYVNDVELAPITYTLSYNSTAPRTGVYRHNHGVLDNGSTFTDYAAWPVTVTLPADASPGYYGDQRAAVPAYETSFDSSADLAGWTQTSGTWGVSNGNAQVIADGSPSIYNRLTRQFASGDGEVSTNITLPNQNNLWHAGVVFRHSAPNNMYIVRFFRIPNDSTIEVELIKILNGQGEIVRFFAIKFESHPGLVELGSTANLTVTARGPWITVYVNSMPVIEYHSTDLMTNTGWGLYADVSDGNDAGGNNVGGALWNDFAFHAFDGNYRPTVLEDTPAGYWRLDDTGATAADVSGNGNNGAYANGVSQEQPGALAPDNNAAAAFDGVDDYVNVPDSASLSPTGAVSVEAWVNLTAYSGSYPRLLSKPGAYELTLYTLPGHEGRLEWKVSLVGGDMVLATALADKLQLGQWYHVVATYDGTTMRIYINGQQKASRSATGALKDSTARFTIGLNAANRFPAARVDEVAVYGTALSAARVLAHYQVVVPPAADPPYKAAVQADSPAGYWRLNETSGTQAADQSANNNTGTYVNGVTLNTAHTMDDDTSNTAVQLDGTNDYVTVSDSASLSPTGAVSVEAWVNLTAYSGSYPRLLSKPGAYELTLYTVAGHEGRLEWKVASVSGDVLLTIAFADRLLLGQWYHVAATYDGTTMRLFINGQQKASRAASGAIKDTSSPFTLGMNAPSRFPAAQFDEVAVYGAALSAARVLAHYQAAVPPPPDPPYVAAVQDDSPAGYWRLNEASGTQAADLSGNGGTGTYVNGVALAQTGALTSESDAAVQLDGTNDYVTVPDSASLSPTAAVSVEAWVNLTAYSGSYPRLLSKPGAYELTLYTVAGHEGRLEWKVSLASGDVLLATALADKLLLGQWYHVAATYDGTTMRVFINGVEEATKAAPGTLRDSPAAFTMSRGDRPVAAKLDEVAVYGAALSVARVQAHYAAR